MRGWTADDVDRAEELTERLAADGVFDEADRFFDALEAGEDVLDDHVNAVELVDQLRLRRP